MWMNEGEVVSIEGKKVGVLKIGGKRVAYPAVERLVVMTLHTDYHPGA